MSDATALPTAPKPLNAKGGKDQMMSQYATIALYHNSTSLWLPFPVSS